MEVRASKDYSSHLPLVKKICGPLNNSFRRPGNMWALVIYLTLTLASLVASLPQTMPLKPRQDDRNLLNATQLGGSLRNCIGKSTSLAPKVEDCINMFEQIPFEPRQQVIYLPKSYTSGKCAVTFETKNGQPITGSWLDLHLAAMHLANGCQVVNNDDKNTWIQPRTGGILQNAGPSGSVVVKLGKPSKMPSLSESSINITNTSTTDEIQET